MRTNATNDLTEKIQPVKIACEEIKKIVMPAEQTK